MTPLIIRSATKADVTTLTQLTRAAFLPWVPVIGRDPLPMFTDYAAAVLQDRIDILEDTCTTLGLIHMIPEPDHLWVETIAIDPDHQGRGLGRYLMTHAETVARSLGLPELRLLTNAAMSSNLRLYTGLGFTQIDHRPSSRGGFVVDFSKRFAP